jgi:protein gp37
MSDNTTIGWTNATWNCVTGCSRVSAGCEHCYAEALSLRFGFSKKPWTAPNAAENVILHPERLDQPFRWKKPRRIFVNSMSDMFHEQIPDDFLRQAFVTMALANWHTYQILTKRPERMRAYLSRPDLRHAWPLHNVWLGVSIEQDRWCSRAEILRETPAAVRFISAEPLLEPLPSLNLADIDWLIVGGESGSYRRPFDVAWARQLRDQAQRGGVALFYKQGGAFKSGQDRVLDGRTWDEYPEVLR